MEKIEDDRELVAKARSGDDDAFADLVRRHHGAVLGLCARMLGDAAQAEDAAQEVFLKAYQSLDNFRGDSLFSTWLYRVASNRCLDLLRRRAREKTGSLDALLEDRAGAGELALGSVADGSAAVADAELVKKALASLFPDYRLILTLREVQGLTYEELCETLDCSMDSVKAKLRRARQSLAEILRHMMAPRAV